MSKAFNILLDIKEDIGIANTKLDFVVDKTNDHEERIRSLESPGKDHNSNIVINGSFIKRNITGARVAIFMGIILGSAALTVLGMSF